MSVVPLPEPRVPVRVRTFKAGDNSLDKICGFHLMPRAYDELVIDNKFWRVIGYPVVFDLSSMVEEGPPAPDYAAQITVLPIMDDETKQQVEWHT